MFEKTVKPKIQLQLFNKSGKQINLSRTIFEILNKSEDPHLYFKFSLMEPQELKLQQEKAQQSLASNKVLSSPSQIYYNFIAQASQVGLQEDSPGIECLKILKFLYLINQNLDFILQEFGPFRFYFESEMTPQISPIDQEFFVNKKLNALLIRQL